MGKSLGELRAEVAEGLRFRGHEIEWTAPWHGEHKSVQGGRCKKCGMEVFLDTKPAPNGIDISGKAVALHCTKP